MMRAALDIAREIGAGAVWLGADDGNDAAHTLYRALGAQALEPGVIYTYGVGRGYGNNGGT